MKKILNRKVLGYMALAVACLMIGSAFLSSQPAQAAATALTEDARSPFVEAIAKVKDSVVGVNNYQLVSTYNNYYGNGYGYGYGFPFGSYGFSYGYGYGNNGNGNNGNGNDGNNGNNGNNGNTYSYYSGDVSVGGGFTTFDVEVTLEEKE